MSTGSTLLATLGALWALAIACSFLGLAWRGVRRLRRGDPAGSGALPPISVLKPITGCDEALEDNLESYFRLDYPYFELLFCFDRQNDPAEAVVDRLSGRYPQVAVRRFRGARGLGANPKINNVAAAYDAAAYDWTLLSDANTRVSEDFLRRLAGSIRPSSGLISAVLACPAPRGRGGRLQAVFFHSFFARAMWLCEKRREPCASAKCLFFRRSLLDGQAGGLAGIADYHADDVKLSKRFLDLGYAVTLLNRPAEVWEGETSLRAFWSRQLRWGRNRRILIPRVFALEVFALPLAVAAIGGLTADILGGPDFALGAGALAALFCATDWLLDRALGARAGLAYPLYWTAAQAAQLALWTCAWLPGTVEWRDRRYRITTGGLLEPA